MSNVIIFLKVENNNTCVCSCLQIYLGTGVGGRHFLEIPEAPLEFGQYIVSLPSHVSNENTISLSEKCHLHRSRQPGGRKMPLSDAWKNRGHVRTGRDTVSEIVLKSGATHSWAHFPTRDSWQWPNHCWVQFSIVIPMLIGSSDKQMAFLLGTSQP